MVVKIVRKRTAHLEKYIRTLAAKKKKKEKDNLKKCRKNYRLRKRKHGKGGAKK